MVVVVAGISVVCDQVRFKVSDTGEIEFRLSKQTLSRRDVRSASEVKLRRESELRASVRDRPLIALMEATEAVDAVDCVCAIERDCA